MVAWRRCPSLYSSFKASQSQGESCRGKASNPERRSYADRQIHGRTFASHRAGTRRKGSRPMRVVKKRQLLSAEEISRTLNRLAHEIVEKSGGAKDLALIGIRRRGVPISERLLKADCGFARLG